jgi:hypothetical protein
LSPDDPNLTSPFCASAIHPSNKDTDDKSTIVPPSTIQTTTPPQTKPNIKKPCTNDGTDDQQTTSTQIWTPRPTQVLDFDSEMNENANKGKTEIKRERRQKLAAITNPYSVSRSK